MTTGHQIEPKISRMRKRPKKTASNARITREPFGDLSTKSLPIPTFIDDYNHYMGGVDQSNQLWASFTTHFPRNQKEFFPGAFWAIDVAVYNSYKLHLALNGSQTSSTGKRDPRQHREWVEDLVNLLFQVKNNEFGEEITAKPYPKYVYEPVSKGPKPSKKETVSESINDFLNHLYGEHPLKKRGHCVFCVKKSNVKPYIQQESGQFSSYLTLQLDGKDESKLVERKRPKREQFRGRYIKWWCQECNKFICNNCWSLYH